jgi:erythronate-4-phosphate dehydrogenase
MIKIVADNKIPFLAGVLESVAKVVYLPGSKISRKHLLDADVLIVRTRTLCNARLLEGTSVKFIASATIGHDHIDKEFCREKSIAWTNAPGCNAGSVVQYVSAALAHIMLKKIPPFGEITLGVIGAGNVGSRLIKVGKTLGIKTLVNDPPRERTEGSEGFCSLDTLLAASDIVTLHVPLNMTGPDKTFHMADQSFLRKMRPGAWLINSSRGEVIETKALVSALQTGKLEGTIIDVWENEPDIDRELLNLVTIATPHIAGYSADGKANGTSMSVQALSRHFRLGLDEWRPQTIPLPEKATLSLSAKAKSKEEIFCELSLQAYDILADDRALREQPETFEKLRGDYPIRREPHALKVKVNGLSGEILSLIRKLGYQLENEK